MNSILTFGENNSLIHNDSININNSLNKSNANYLNLSNDEIIKETNSKKIKIIEYHNTNKVLKKELTNILEKVNLLATKNKDEQNLENLKKIINDKKFEYFRIQKYNSDLKKEYSILSKKIKNINDGKISDIVYNYKSTIENLKNENKEIKKEIQKNETQKIEQQNQVKKIKLDNSKFQALSNYNTKLNKYLLIKNNFINGINNANKNIEDNKQELNKLENIIKNKSQLISKNEKISNKINNELDIIKNDLSGTIEEIVEKCLNDNMMIYSLLNNDNKKNEKEEDMDEININNNSSRISSNISIVKSPSVNSINKIKTRNNKKKDIIKIYPIIHRNNSQSFITDKIHTNSSYNLNNNLRELNDLISSENKKEINLLDKKSLDIFKLKFKNKKYISLDFSNISYNQVDQGVYQKLLDKKKYFLEESERMDNNIKKIKTTFLTKNNKVTKSLKSNIIKLNDIKGVNLKIQEEINKLKDLLKEIESKQNEINNK